MNTRRSAVVTGVAAVSAFGRGADALLSGALAGRSAFRPVDRFDVSRRRVGVAATLAGVPVLADELARVVADACAAAGLDGSLRAGSRLFLAVHGDPALARAAEEDRPAHGAHALASALAARTGLAAGTAPRTYTPACVAASTALADAPAPAPPRRAD